MSWPGLLLWAMIVLASLSNGPALIYMLPMTDAFTSVQMLPGDPGGANLMPTTVCAAALVVKVASQRGNLLRGLEAALDPARFGLFTAFVVYGTLTALLLPRIFAGQVEVIPASGDVIKVYGGSLLKPGFGNFSQVCYLLVSYLTVAAFSVIGGRTDVRHHYMQALVWGAFILALTGVIDLVFYQAGLSELLSPFRTVKYSLLTDVEVEVFVAKRVVGLTPEATIYGPVCVTGASALLFLRPLYPAGRPRLAATAAFFLLVVMAFLSTSSTANVGLAVLLSLFVIDLIYRTLFKSGKAGNRLRWEVRAAVLIVLGALVFGLAMLDQVAPMFQLINESVFNKTNSDSYLQRSLWTQIGRQAFLDTGGLGVGVGSSRTSIWAVNILGETGLFGGLLMFGFLAQKLFPSTKDRRLEERSFAHALKLALLPPLAMSFLNGSMTDIGTGIAAIIGFLSCENASSSGEEHGAAAAPFAAEST